MVSDRLTLKNNTPDRRWSLLIKVPFFRATAEDYRNLSAHHLVVGLILTWLAGIGRYWDHPKADLLQYLGLGSVIYVFLLAFIIDLLFLPLKPKNFSYQKVLTFLTLTSPLAFFYAIPVERFTTLETAITLNGWFLAVVATWRVALTLHFLKKLTSIPWGSLVVTLTLILMAIVSALAALNLEKVVFDFMGGFHEQSPNDEAYTIVFFLTLLSYLGVIPFLFFYLFSIWYAWYGPGKPKPGEEESPNS
jgi:hypothetical protein